MTDSMIMILHEVGINSSLKFPTQYTKYYWRYFNPLEVDISSSVLYKLYWVKFVPDSKRFMLVVYIKISHMYEHYDLPYGDIRFNSYSKDYFRDNVSRNIDF